MSPESSTSSRKNTRSYCSKTLVTVRQEHTWLCCFERLSAVWCSFSLVVFRGVAMGIYRWQCECAATSSLHTLFRESVRSVRNGRRPGQAKLWTSDPPCTPPSHKSVRPRQSQTKSRSQRRVCSCCNCCFEANLMISWSMYWFECFCNFCNYCIVFVLFF